MKNSSAVGHCKRTGQIGRPGAGALSSQNGWIKMVLQRFAGDVFHYEEGRSLRVDPYVVELHDGRIGELADELRLAQELLFPAFSEAVDKTLEGHDAADNIVAGLFHAAGSARAEGLEGFVAAFLHGDHQAERSRRAARSRKPLLLVCGAETGTAIVLRRASGKSSSARASAGA